MPVDLTRHQLNLLCWLAREEKSQYGECYGADLDQLRRLGFVMVTTDQHDVDHPSDQPDIGWPPPSKFHGVNLTQAAHDYIAEQAIDIWRYYYDDGSSQPEPPRHP